MILWPVMSTLQFLSILSNENIITLPLSPNEYLLFMMINVEIKRSIINLC